MRLIAFSERCGHKGGSLSGSSSELSDPIDSIRQYFHSLGEVLEAEYFDDKYSVALIRIKPTDIHRLFLHRDLGEFVYEFKYFADFRQFSRYALNLERRFVLFFATEKQSQQNLAIVKSETKATLRVKKVAVPFDEYETHKGFKEMRQTYNILKEPCYKFLVELEQRKNGLTTCKFQRLSQLSVDGVVFERLRIFTDFLKAIKKWVPPRCFPDCLTPPTKKLYHFVMRNDLEDDRANSDKYVFNMGTQPLYLKKADGINTSLTHAPQGSNDASSDEDLSFKPKKTKSFETPFTDRLVPRGLFPTYQTFQTRDLSYFEKLPLRTAH